MANKTLAYSGRDTRGALLRCQAIQWMHGTRTKADMDLFMQLDGWTVTLSDFTDWSVGQSRRYWCVTSENYFFLFVDGIENADEGRSVWDGYTGPYPRSLDNVPDPENYFFTSRGQRIAVVANGLFKPAKAFFVGYSAGAPIAYFAARAMLDTWGHGIDNELIAIGSPKPATFDSTLTAGINRFTSWENIDDAVPLIPPRLDFWPRVTAGLSVWQSARLQTFWGFSDTTVITLTGQLQPLGPPTPGLPAPVEQIGAWLQLAQANIENPHSISVYIARLTLATLSLPRGNPIAPTNPSPSPPSTLTGPQIRQAIAAAVQTQFHDASRQNSQPVNLPGPEAFTVLKKGKVYYVAFRGTPIAVAPRRRRAHGLARTGNAWLRRLQNEGMVYPDDLTSEMAAYLADASDPNSAFRPTMNVPQN